MEERMEDRRFFFFFDNLEDLDGRAVFAFEAR